MRLKVETEKLWMYFVLAHEITEMWNATSTMNPTGYSSLPLI